MVKLEIDGKAGRLGIEIDGEFLETFAQNIPEELIAQRFAEEINKRKEFEGFKKIVLTK